MSPLAQVRGFDELWAPIARGGRRVADVPVLPPAPHGRDPKARLANVVRRAPEVMVKITGKTRDGEHLKAHLEYISRDGELPLEGRDGEQLKGLEAVRELGGDWAAEDLKRRSDASMSVSIVLSMPPGTDYIRMRDAARAFARDTFGETHDYVFALHTDAGHPHVHLSVRSLGEDGRRLSPRKADLESWRQRFAEKLRERGVAAEATLRRARGVTKKAERTPIRKMRERYERGQGPAPRVLDAAYREAARLARGGSMERPWERRIVERQASVRSAYAAVAQALSRSTDPADRALARDVNAFVKAMPQPATRRNELIRAIRALRPETRDRPAPEPPKDRPRRR